MQMQCLCFLSSGAVKKTCACGPWGDLGTNAKPPWEFLGAAYRRLKTLCNVYKLQAHCAENANTCAKPQRTALETHTNVQIQSALRWKPANSKRTALKMQTIACKLKAHCAKNADIVFSRPKRTAL